MGLVFEAFSLLTMQVGGSRRLEGVSEKDTTAQPLQSEEAPDLSGFLQEPI